ncbi:Crp/Fnr family transcriptional regulator [Marinilabilia salmonicolor]|uniref:Crp/Fnr family transcriptional regulator n=1 Tax=Marinilabilia salmonicolor TaxID=989 RepID=UPI00029AD4CB|nr:Crp/Fnr family transcriptional regulator [Marinilabilia salmonicolor]
MCSLKQVITDITPLSDEAFAELKRLTTTKSLEKNDFVLKQDAICRHIYFVNTGMIRIYYLKNGRDVTEWFACDRQFCFSITSYFHEVPSKLIIQCIEDCEITYLPKSGLEKASDENLEISRFYRSLFAGSLIGSQLRMESIQFETALQRYQSLMNNNPEIIQRAPLKYIASFLGITFETLSRIRHQLH